MSSSVIAWKFANDRRSAPPSARGRPVLRANEELRARLEKAAQRRRERNAAYYAKVDANGEWMFEQLCRAGRAVGHLARECARAVRRQAPT